MKKTKRRPAAVIAAEKPGGDAVDGRRLIDRHELMAMTGLAYPKIWKLMREGAFPRARAVGDKSMWISSEIDAWIDALPNRKLKGDSDGVPLHRFGPKKPVEAA